MMGEEELSPTFHQTIPRLNRWQTDMAQTVTGTATYSRFSLLLTQVRVLLRDTVEISDDVLTRIVLGLKDPHYIDTVIVEGLLAGDAKAAELRLAIDWREHALQVKAGGEQLQVPRHWNDAIAPSVSEAVNTFNEACGIAGLRKTWSVMYDSRFDFDTTNGILGFRAAPIRDWIRPPDELGLDLGPLREGSLMLRLAID